MGNNQDQLVIKSKKSTGSVGSAA
jgi:hypothetical protein